MIDRRRAFGLFGESLRETGVLIVVFVPLDAVFQRQLPSLLFIGTSILLGLLFTSIGIIIEAAK